MGFVVDDDMKYNLQLDFALNCYVDTIDHTNEIILPDIKLLRAMDTLIEFYSSPNDYKQWCTERDVYIQNVNDKLDPIDKIVW